MRKADVIDAAMRVAGFCLMAFMMFTGRDNEFALMVAAVMIFAPAKGVSLLKMRFGPALNTSTGPDGSGNSAVTLVADEEPKPVGEAVASVGTDQPTVADDGDGGN